MNAFDSYDYVSDFKDGPYSGLSVSSDAVNFPDLYTFEAASQDRDITNSSTPILGVTGSGEPLTLDLESESPHVLIAGGSGGAKSGIARAIVSQMLADGAEAVILDAKQHSHTWAKGIPNVKYAETFPQIGNAWVWLARQVHYRNHIAKEFMWANRDNPDVTIEDAPVGPRIVVLAEELNATMGRLQSMLSSYETGNRNKKSPAMDALGDVMFMGRAAKIHVVAVAQYASAQALGGGEIRENFNTRIIVNFTRNQWNMLAKEIDWPRGCPEQKGRGFTCRAGKARETQYLYITEQEARALATSNLPRALTAAPSPSGPLRNLPVRATR